MPYPRILARWIGLASLACALSAAAGVNSWTMTGPDSGWVTAIEIHPTNPQIALAATTGGLYRTSDGGANWTRLNEKIFTPRNMAFDPTNPNRVFVANANSDLWVSNDAGAVFAPAQPPEFGTRQVEFSSSGVLYLQSLSARMFKSTNQGATWTACGRPWGDTDASNAFTVDPNPHAQDRLYMEVRRASAPNGTWRSDDGCATWTMTGANSPASGPDELVTNYSVMPSNPDRVLASTSVGVKLSVDAGASWNLVTFNPSWWVEYDPVSTSGDAVALQENARVLRSVDRGEHWGFHGTTSAPGNSTFALDPQMAGRMLLGTQNGLYLSADYGTTFTLRNKGMAAGEVSDFSVADDGTVYASFYPGAGGVFRRNPSNGSWAPVDNVALRDATISQVFHVSHVATGPSDSSLLYVGNYFNSVTQSSNAGVTWQTSHFAFRNVAAVPSDTAVDPDNALVAYTATSNHGMWKTVDGGVSWVEVNNSGLPWGARLVAAARGSDVVYAAVADPNILFPGAIYKSTNGGASWAATGATPIGAGQGWFNDIVIDPKNPDVVYAPFHFGVYRTTNGGTSWALMEFPGVPNPQTWALSVSIDPQFSSTLLVSRMSDGALVRTVDGGANWQRIEINEPGSNLKLLNRALFNPARPGQIIAGVVLSDIGEYDVATDLALSISGVASSVATSASISASIDIENRGPHAASPSRTAVTLPAWMVPSTPAGCTRSGQTLSCDVPALQVGQTHSFPVTFAVSASSGTGSITGNLITHETDQLPANNALTLPVVGIQHADLALTLTPASATVDRGASVTVTASMVNHGPNPSTGTELTLEIPAGLTLQSFTTSLGTCSQSGTGVECALGTMAVNATATVTLQMTAVAKGGQIVVGRLDGDGVDTGNDQFATAEIGVRAVGDVAVTLAESADPVTVGTSFSYTATLSNLSGDSANLQFQMGVSGTTTAAISSITPVGVACSFDAFNVHCSGLEFAAGGTATVTVNVASTTPGIVITNATVSYGGTDTNTDNNSASIGTTLRLVGDVSVEIVDSVDPASVGLPYAYVVTVRNAGPNAGAVDLSIPVTGASVSAATSSAGTCVTLVMPTTCTIPSLASGASVTVTLTAHAFVPGTASATATATFVGVDPDLSNNSATAETLARRVADIGVTIAESADPVTAGNLLSYVVTLTTAGPSEGNVRLSVPVTGGAVTGATPSQGGTCTIAAGTVTCDFNPLSVSPSTVDLVLNSTTAGTVTATATATFSGTDPVATNNTATATTTVNAAPPPPPPPSGGGSSGGGGGGGGGGRFDWLAAGLLGLLLARRKPGR